MNIKGCAMDCPSRERELRASAKKDTDLDPLREREDFKKLLAERCSVGCQASSGVGEERR